MAIFDSIGNIVVEYSYDAWGKCTVKTNVSGIAAINPFRYRGYYLDDETGLYYLNARYYDPEIGRFISPDGTEYLDPESVNGLNIYVYCGNNPVINIDPSGQFLISTAVLIGAIIGGIIGATVGGVVAYNVASNSGAEGWELVGWTLLGVIGGGAVGAAIGAGVGYAIGYFAGGTYANGLVAKAVSTGVKSFVSQDNKVHHVMNKAAHNLSNYTVKAMTKLMKKTLKKGTVEAYKKVKSAFLASTSSEVTFTIINGIIYISDMWIR